MRKRYSIRFIRQFTVAISIVIIIIAVSVFLGFNSRTNFLMEQQLTSEARNLFQQIMLVRKWVKTHGGVYVRQGTGIDKPTHRFEYGRKNWIVDTDGTIYVHRNSSHLTKALSNLTLTSDGNTYRATSLDPLNPEDAPDDFERRALTRFEAGETEVMGFEESAGKISFRYMKALQAKKECISCHADHGFKPGGVGGGISIQIPAEQYMQGRMINFGVLLASLAVILLLFISLVVVLYRHLVHNVSTYEQQLVNQEKTLHQAYKESALGSLAGGMAHEFNNLLLPIMSLTDMTLRSLPEDSRDRKRLAKVSEAAKRAKNLVDHVMTYSRQTKPEQQNQDLRTIIIEAMELIKATMPANIKLTEKLDENVGSAFVDAEKIKMLMVNILSNAMDAIGNQQGRITLTLYSATVEEPSSLAVNVLKAGRYAIIALEDSGCGMDGETLSRAFDPFFTSKEVGEGSGMGLATVAGIVTDHDGAIDVSSAVGEGTRVTIYLPLIHGENE